LAQMGASWRKLEPIRHWKVWCERLAQVRDWGDKRGGEGKSGVAKHQSPPALWWWVKRGILRETKQGRKLLSMAMGEVWGDEEKTLA